MNEPKTINNNSIMEAKNKLANAVNDIINDGIPISIVSMCLHLMADDVDRVLAQVLESERHSGGEQDVSK